MINVSDKICIKGPVSIPGSPVGRPSFGDWGYRGPEWDPFKWPEGDKLPDEIKPRGGGITPNPNPIPPLFGVWGCKPNWPFIAVIPEEIPGVKPTFGWFPAKVKSGVKPICTWPDEAPGRFAVKASKTRPYEGGLTLREPDGQPIPLAGPQFPLYWPHTILGGKGDVTRTSDPFPI